MIGTELQPQRPKDRKDKRERISPRLRHALDLMIWGDQTGQPLAYDEAGRATNISTRSMRKSLDRPAVRTYLAAQREVLRAALSAKHIYRLDELVMQNTNRAAAVAALRLSLGDPDEARSNTAQTPGVTINIIPAPPVPALVDVRSIPVPQGVLDAQRPPTIDHEPSPAKADPTIFRPRRDW
jgi:hypothetical protein